MNKLKNKLLKNEVIFFSSFASKKYKSFVTDFFNLPEEVVGDLTMNIILYKSKKQEILYEDVNGVFFKENTGSASAVYVSSDLLPYGFTVILSAPFETLVYKMNPSNFNFDAGQWLANTRLVYLYAERKDVGKFNSLLAPFMTKKPANCVVKLLGKDLFPKQFNNCFMDVITLNEKTRLKELMCSITDVVTLNDAFFKQELTVFMDVQFNHCLSDFVFQHIEEPVLKNKDLKIVLNQLDDKIKDISPLFTKEIIQQINIGTRAWRTATGSAMMDYEQTLKNIIIKSVKNELFKFN